MSAFFMMADTKGGQGRLSTAKIAAPMKPLPNLKNTRHDFATDTASNRLGSMFSG
jgi:hypothetical protein